MRVPVWLAWLLIALSFFTAGLLRRFHDKTPTSPYVSPIVGSLLFAAIFVLLLVSAREWSRGAVPGRGIRLGSLTPILIMLLVEKWASLAIYPPVFRWLSLGQSSPALLDAQFRAFAGVGLILGVLLVSGLSIPTARKVWRRARPSRWPAAAVGTLLVVGATYLLLGATAWAMGGGLALRWPRPGVLLAWVLGGQALLAFGEELYYRGLLMSEMERLAPRLGVRRATARRWLALGSTALLFGMEHVRLNASGPALVQQLVFTISLALLFGLLVMLSANLHFGSSMHAWINWLLLGAAPYYVDAAGQPALPSGTYIGITLILAFVLTYAFRRLWHRQHG